MAPAGPQVSWAQEALRLWGSAPASAGRPRPVQGPPAPRARVPPAAGALSLEAAGPPGRSVRVPKARGGLRVRRRGSRLTASLCPRATRSLRLCLCELPASTVSPGSVGSGWCSPREQLLCGRPSAPQGQPLGPHLERAGSSQALEGGSKASFVLSPKLRLDTRAAGPASAPLAPSIRTAGAPACHGSWSSAGGQAQTQ